MPTVRQKRLAKVIIENTVSPEPLNKGQMLEKVGYSPNLVKQPGRVIEAEGVQEALMESGFTEDNAKKVVESIMLDPTKDPNARLKASDMVFKVHGSYAPDKNININITQKAIDPTDETVIEHLKAIQEKLENE